MGEVLTLISGKGGSGKTTLGLAIAMLLSKCGQKVLLIDCDMSTHGATYFFESKLTDEKLTTTFDIFYSNPLYDNNDSISKETFMPIKNSNSFDFVPSVKQISDKHSDDYIIKAEFCDYNFIDIKDNYNIVILDCQAGYSDFTKNLIRLSDVSLFVLEADAVSASAMRVLYTKLFNELNIHKLQTYQIFNKVQEKEVEIYSNTKFGTFFTNIKPVLFDWSVREAFQENMIPLIDTENNAFTSDMCRLTRSLFPKLANDIIKYEIEVKKKILIQESEKIKATNIKNISYTFSVIAIVITTLMWLLLTLLVLAYGESLPSNSFAAITLIMFILIFIFSLPYTNNSKFIKERNKSKEVIKKLKNEINLLLNQK